MAEIRVTLDQAAIGRMLRSPDGPVWRDINQKGLRVQEEARRLVSGEMLNVRTGRGRAGITMKMATIGSDPAAIISTSPSTPYMAALHEGTRPHIIEPSKARVLRFNVGGRTVFAKVVHHPGTHARRFLVEALKVLRGA